MFIFIVIQNYIIIFLISHIVTFTLINKHYFYITYQQ